MFQPGFCKFDGSDKVYACFYPIERRYWNGWACPVGLERRSFLEFMRTQINLAEKDEFATEFFVDCCECVRVVTINCGDKDEETLYTVDDLGLCWEECDKKGATI